jgi:type I restriction enzyme, S subunit
MFGDPVTNPKGWPVKQLDDICEVAGGLQVTSARANAPLSLPYLRVANVFRDRLDLRAIKEIRLTESEVQRTLLQNGDVLIVEGHGNPEELGRAAVWHAELPRCTHQNHLIRVRTDPKQILPLYLSAFLNSPSGRRQMLRLGKTTSGLNTISTNNVRSLHLVVPPVAIQTAFAQAVNKTRQLAARLEQAYKDFNVLFDALIARAFERV